MVGGLAATGSGCFSTDTLRDVGDRCLLIAGLYPALADRRRVNSYYFIDIGRSAYMDIADAGRNAYAALFGQLARSYEDLVRLLRAFRPETPTLSFGYPTLRGAAELH